MLFTINFLIFFFRYIRKLGFRYVKKTNQRLARENAEVATKRAEYLRQVKKDREDGRLIVYTDETWVNLNHRMPKEWTHNCPGTHISEHCSECLYKFPEGKGRRLILVDAGSEEGFVTGANWIFMSKTGNPDYHQEMNGECFMDWWKNHLLPNLHKPSTIIIDNAPYYNIRTPSSISPSSSTRKLDILHWLREKGIACSDDMTKIKLLQLVKLHAPRPTYIIEEMAEALGHKVLRLPPRHPELNAIEMVWAYVKGYVAKNNTTGTESQIKSLINEACVKANSTNIWSNITNHTKSIERQYYRGVGRS